MADAKLLGLHQQGHPAPGRANFRSIFYLWRFFVIMTILRGTIQTQEHRFKLRSTY